MPSLNMAFAHHLPLGEALKRIKGLLTQIMQEHEEIIDLRESWPGDTGYFIFRTQDVAVSGTIEVFAEEVSIKGELPLASEELRVSLENTFRQFTERLLTSV